MRIPRLSFPGSLPKPAPFDTVPLDYLQSRHGLKALRLSPGRVIELAGPWGLAPAEVVEAGQKGGRPILLVRLTGPFIAAPLDGPTLALALVKGPRFDWAVEKASELGAAKLVPLLTARTASSSVAGEAKRSRWERLSEEARKQCGRVSPMEVAEPLALMEFLESGPPGPRLLLDYDGHGFPDGRGGVGTLLIGP
ncbi:MAG: 16S rRNA (uracil(1498)-N(3))-methyltransferase, partial [Deltaproteobacteria bacterium]|nr:16S rRNA (uracil(1498)-N(3))-methyltransferase [Deltaproteobacteria bacterium]